MNDPLIARFADACGATGPLDLRVGLAEGGALAEGTVKQPFTLVGRDDSCDVTLSDPDVHPRHAWLQVVDGRVYALDLGSRTGLVWPTGATGPGWLDVGVPMRVGPFRVALRSPVSPAPAPASNTPPLQADPVAVRSRPPVHLDFRNGRRAKDRWSVNRVLTLVGRSETCKIHLHSDDISSYHCGLVLTRTGLWVVDLSGRGVVVNGERMRVAPLTHGAELWVGRFLISCHDPGSDQRAARPAATTTTAAAAAMPEPTRVMPVLPLMAEDEVPLGRMPSGDHAGGLPSSHIMCDAFRPSSASGPISAAILVSSNALTPVPVTPRAPDRIPTDMGGLSGVLSGVLSSGRLRTEPRPPAPLPPPAEPDGHVAALLRQLGDIHGQMFAQVQQSLQMVVQLCGRMGPNRTAAVEQELARIKELNAELAKFQAEISRLALAQALGGTHPADATPPGPVRSGADAADAIEDWVQERIGTLQRERESRWQTLVGLFGDRE